MNPRALLLALLMPVSTPPAPVAGTQEASEVRRGDLIPEVRLKGVVKAQSVKKIHLRPEAFQGRWRVVEAAPSGLIQAGELMVRFEDTDLKQELTEARTHLAEVEAQKAALEARERLMTAQDELELKDATLEMEKAREDLKAHKDYDAKLDVSRLELAKKQSDHYLSMQEEELKQLDEMYRKNELAESTRDYVVERERRNLELSKEGNQLEETERARRKAHDLPRTLRELEERVAGLERQESLRSARAASVKADMRVSLLQVASELSRTQHSISNLEYDTTLIALKAPDSGVLVTDLEPGDEVTPGSLLAQLHVGGAVRVEATTESPVFGGKDDVATLHHRGRILKAELESRRWKPEEASESRWMLRFRVEDAGLVLGEPTSVLVTQPPLTGVLLVNRSALTWGEGKTTARKVTPGGKSVEVEVLTGATDGTYVQILEGLAEGDRLETQGE